MDPEERGEKVTSPSFRNAAIWEGSEGNTSGRAHLALHGTSTPISFPRQTIAKHSHDDIEEVKDPTSVRSLKPAPGHGESARFQRRVGSETINSNSENIKTTNPYIVIGIFDGIERWPKERVILVRHPSLFLFQVWWGMVKLRGVYYVFSLKGVMGFRLYKYNWASGVDEHLQLNKDDNETLRIFHRAYTAWSPSKSKEWAAWVQENLNSRKLRSGLGPPSRAICLEMVIDWCPTRISIVVLVPVLLSLIIGIWYQSKDPNDMNTIQTAWTIASYIASAGGLMAALLAILSSIADK